MSEILEKIKEVWANLDPRWRVIGMIAVIGMSIGTVDRYVLRPVDKPEPAPATQQRLSPGVTKQTELPFNRQFDDDMFADVRRDQQAFQRQMQEKIEAQEQELQALREQARIIEQLQPYLQHDGSAYPPPGISPAPSPSVPEPEARPRPGTREVQQQQYQPAAPEPVRTVRWSGGVRVAENSFTPEVITEEKVRRTVYMPSGSFARATLLNGTSAKTSLAGQSNPHIVKLRIDDLTVLPNDLKRNLDGCFIQASAHGDLADERVHLELATLSCLTHDGRGVIDQNVKGYVTAADGQKGLPGEVFAAFPGSLWRGALVSAIGGLGEFASEYRSNSTTTVTGAGLVSEQGNMSFEDYVIGGLGTGVRQYTEDLAEFYSSLIRQQGPSIQILPGARVTVHFSTGTELKIREICNEELEQCDDLS